MAIQVNDIDSRWMQLMSGCLSSRRQDKGEAVQCPEHCEWYEQCDRRGRHQDIRVTNYRFLDGFPRLAPSGNSVVTLAGAISGALTGLDGVVWGMPPEINQQGLPG